MLSLIMSKVLLLVRWLECPSLTTLSDLIIANYTYSLYDTLNPVDGPVGMVFLTIPD